MTNYKIFRKIYGIMKTLLFIYKIGYSIEREKGNINFSPD